MGLENLQSIGGDLDISYNKQLRFLDGLFNLKSIGGKLVISDNNFLQIKYKATAVPRPLHGLSIDGDVEIKNNDVLTDLNLLSNVTYIGRKLEIRNNRKLTNLYSLGDIEEINGDLVIAENDSLFSISLNSLRYVRGNLRINNNSSLESLNE